MSGVEGHDRQEQLLRVLRMVADGALSPAEADELIAALHEPVSRSGGAQPPDVGTAAQQPSGVSPPGRPAPSGSHIRLDPPGPAGTTSGESRRSTSAELRRLGREARRMAHEARRISRRDLRDALREAKHEIERAMRLSLEESSRAVREVEAELRGIFGEAGAGARRRHPRWVSRLAGLDMSRDTVKQTSSLELQQEVAPHETITVRNTSGDVFVRGWDEMRVEVRGDRTAWGLDKEMAQDRAESLPIEISQRNGEIIVEARPPVPAGIGVLNILRTHTDLVVMVPARAALEITARNGDVTVVGHRGPLSANTTRGDISLTDPQGRVRAETVSGDIQLGPGPVAELELISVSGDISASVNPVAGGQYRLRSASGDVTVRVEAPASCVLRYEVETVSGDLHVELGGKLLTRERGRIAGEMIPEAREGAGPAPDQRDGGQAAAILKIATISGDVSVS